MSINYSDKYSFYLCPNHNNKITDLCYNDFWYLNCRKCFSYYLKLLELFRENVQNNNNFEIKDIDYTSYDDPDLNKIFYHDGSGYTPKDPKRHICTYDTLYNFLTLINFESLFKSCIEDAIKFIRTT